MYDFSFVGQILKRRDQLIPRYTDREIRDVMWHPMTLWEILRSPASKSKSLAAYVIAHLPSALAVLGIKIIFHTVLKHYR
jgi:hypothetical protein